MEDYLHGVPMYKVIKKLKLLKSELRNLNKKAFADIEEQFYKARDHLRNCQQDLHLDPLSMIASDRERQAAEDFIITKKVYSSFLAQKAKIRWLKEGDDNTSFFRKAIKVRKLQQRVLAINDMNGATQITPDTVNKAFEEFYITLLGTEHSERRCIQPNINGPVLNDRQGEMLLQDFSNEEIKAAIFSIPGSKAPGPDGYNSTFFKKAWPIIGPDTCDAVRDIFSSGKLLKELNATKLTLIPKTTHPQHASELCLMLVATPFTRV